MKPVALITGGARMGTIAGQRLSRLGFHILFTYRSSKEAAEKAIQGVRSTGGSAAALECDLADAASIQTLAQQIRSEYGTLNVLVNLASIYKTTPTTGDVAASWEENMNANARGAYLLSRAVAPLMNESGRMVHISDWTSASGRPRYKSYSAYYVSKAAVKAVVECLALELAPKILVNGIAPGPILQPPEMAEAEIKEVERATPLGRWGGAEEIAKAVQFLVETEFVTGEVIRVDGGRHLQ
jgi:pteridine reductase